MAFSSETEFENHIRGLIEEEILSKDRNLLLLNSKKAVDIIICRNGNDLALLLIEIKYDKIKHGRLGTGHGKGGGFQPEVLAKQPDYFKTNMRWIIGTEEREGYILIKNEELVDHISGGVIGEKYNTDG